MILSLFWLCLGIAGLRAALRWRNRLIEVEQRGVRDADEIDALRGRIAQLESRIGIEPMQRDEPPVEMPAQPSPSMAAFGTEKDLEESTDADDEPVYVPTVAELLAPESPRIEEGRVPPVAPQPPSMPMHLAEAVSPATVVEGALAAPAEPAGIGTSPPPAPPQGGWRRFIPALPPMPTLPNANLDWENIVGVKLFSWIAGVALVFAAIFFLRYSIEHGWLSPAIRMAIGLIVGAGLLVVCEMRAAQRYPVTANALDAAGIAILFATFFASHALWDLLPQLPVFILMALVAAVAVLLSVRRDSIFIAILGLVGGFATPALLSTGQDRPIGLFSYLMLLNLGILWVGYRKQWPQLITASVLLSALYQWGWALKYLDAGRLPLAMVIFAIFPVLHMAARLINTRGEDEAAQRAPLFEQTALASTVLPLLFTVFLASVPAYGSQYTLLFGFLFLVVAGLTIVAVERGPQALHAIGGVATVMTFLIWFGLSYLRADAWPGILGFVVLFIALYLATPLLAEWRKRPMVGDARLVQVVAALLVAAFPVLTVLEPSTAEPALLFGVLFTVLAAIAAVAVWTENGPLHFASAFFALAAEAIWSAHFLTPDRLLSALIMYAGFGLFYVGVPVVAERLGKKLEPQGSGAVILFISLGFLFFLAIGPVAATALWGLALLLMILNAGLFFEASRGRFPMLSLAGVVLSWALIAIWWSSAMTSALLIPSLLIVAGFAALILAGNVWMQRRAGEAGAASANRGVALALVGHFFLLFVASQEELALPPWPLFGILALLDLGVGVAALYVRQAQLLRNAIALSQLILMVWIGVAEEPPWPSVGIVAAGAVAVFALGWIALARRVRATGDEFGHAALAALFLAEVVVLVAAGQPVPPSMTWIATAHILAVVAILGVATAFAWFDFSVWAVVLPLVQAALYLRFYLNAETWAEHLLLAAALCAPFVLYALWLGKRGGRAREPYLAVVLASAGFFILARQCMVIGGLQHIIAVLPVGQALILLAVLARLISIEEPGEKQSGRVALVAAAALAFITGAIPLQLEREWITIGWALEAVALAWLYRRIPHQGLLAWSSGLAITVLIRLALNPAVLAYHPRSDVAIFNWYLYTYLIAAAAMFAAARLLRTTNDRVLNLFRVSDLLPGAGTILLFLLLNIEIADFYSSTGAFLTFNFSAGLAQDLTYTIGWAVFAIGLLAAGITAGQRIPRTAALALLTGTVVKCFLHDLWRLGGLYRVGSFVGLAVCLALVAILMQRFVLGAQRETA